MVWMKFISLICAVLGVLFSPFALLAEENSKAVPLPVDHQAPPMNDDCSKELLLSYYPEEFVLVSLKKYNVPQDRWDPIVRELKTQDKAVIKLVEAKAQKVDPNLLKDPQQREKAIKIFRETLLEVFASVLKPNGVTDDGDILAILDDVQQQKAKRFAQCIEKRKLPLPTELKR